MLYTKTSYKYINRRLLGVKNIIYKFKLRRNTKYNKINRRKHLLLALFRSK